jgi:hypothetical protein
MLRKLGLRIGIFFVACAAILTAAQVLSGCKTGTPDQQTQLEKDAALQITCTTGEDCEIKWGRAIDWIKRNSHWTIRNQTDFMIQTYPSVGGSAASSFLVTKLSLGSDDYKIAMTSVCDNFLACRPSTTELRAYFNRFVLGAEKKEQP